jgi:hypothetical protein
MHPGVFAAQEPERAAPPAALTMALLGDGAAQ